MRQTLFVMLLVAMVWAGDFYYINGGKRIELTPIYDGNATLTRREAPKSLRFIDSRGREVEVGNRILIKFKNDGNLDEYLNRYHLKVVKKMGFKKMYLLEALDAESAIEAANALSEMSDVAFAQPDIARKRVLR